MARKSADAAKADAVIVNGDLAINGPDSEAEIAFAATTLGYLRTRVIALPGNHDVGDEPPGQDADQIIDADRLARWDNFVATDRWALDAGGWRLIGVNAQPSARARRGNTHRSSGSTRSCVPRAGPPRCPAQASLPRKSNR